MFFDKSITPITFSIIDRIYLTSYNDDGIIFVYTDNDDTHETKSLLEEFFCFNYVKKRHTLYTLIVWVSCMLGWGSITGKELRQLRKTIGEYIALHCPKRKSIPFRTIFDITSKHVLLAKVY